MKNDLAQKLKEAPNEIIELFSLLTTEEDAFLETFCAGIKDTKVILENQIRFVNNAFSLGYHLINTVELESFLGSLGCKGEERSIVISNIKENFLPTMSDFLETEETQTLNENPLEEAKLADAGHISHVDILSEIENPTPSINTTATFQKEVSQKINVTTEPVAANIGVSTPKSNALQNNTLSTNPSLHSSDPSVVPYSNPALHIASKLDQNLSTPSASVPKDIYVSKKPDPYHEPVEM